jgi:hypothetical protein
MAQQIEINLKRFWLETCFRCKVEFAMSDEVHAVAVQRRESGCFYCPNGHSQVYVTGETEVEKMRRERDRAIQEQARLHDRIREERESREAMERKNIATRGVVIALSYTWA